MRESNKDTLIKSRVLECLEYARMTQKKLAEEIQMSPEQICRILREGKAPKRTILLIAHCLDVSPDYLTGKSKVPLTELAYKRGEMLKSDDFMRDLFVFFGRDIDDYGFSALDIRHIKDDINMLLHLYVCNAELKGSERYVNGSLLDYLLYKSNE